MCMLWAAPLEEEVDRFLALLQCALVRLHEVVDPVLCVYSGEGWERVPLIERDKDIHKAREINNKQYIERERDTANNREKYWLKESEGEGG